MRGIAAYFCVAFIMVFFFTQPAFADELSDMREELKAMRKQMEEQAAKMEEMRQKIEKLESEKPALAKVEKPAASDKDFRAYWDNGIKLDTADKNFQMKIGTMIMADFAGMKEDSKLKGKSGKLDAAAEFRRLRLYTTGSVFKDYVYKVQLDFANGNVTFKDVYAGIQNVPILGLVRIGQFKEPFSLEELTTSAYQTFMERGLPYAFSIHRQMGLGFNTAFLDERTTLAASVFYNANNVAKPTSNAINAAVRLTGLPWYEDEGEKLLHLGAAYSLRHPDNNKNFRYYTDPEIHLAPDFVDTENFGGKYANLVGLESALVYGPLSVQGELMQSFVELRSAPKTGYFEGFYVYASYFLTGEHRAYDKSMAVFSRVKPINNFSLSGNKWGAWEIAARYSYLDLCDQNVSGGVLSDMTLGLNWHLNPGMQLMLNYVHAHRNGRGDADILGTRMQVYF